MNADDSVALAARLEDVGRVVGRAAHDFRNALTGIVGFAELSLMQLAPTSPPHRYITDLLGVCRRGQAMTEQLHQLSRAGNVNPQASDLLEVWKAEADRIKGSVSAKIETTESFPDAMPPVRIGKDPLRLVIAQVLDNALEAMPNGGRLAVSAATVWLTPDDCASSFGRSDAGMALELAIADSGPSISPEVMEKLFREPFLTTKPQHRGLGLATVFRILFAHQGSIRLETKAGQGTIARIYFPIAGV